MGKGPKLVQHVGVILYLVWHEGSQKESSCGRIIPDVLGQEAEGQYDSHNYGKARLRVLR